MKSFMTLKYKIRNRNLRSFKRNYRNEYKE